MLDQAFVHACVAVGALTLVTMFVLLVRCMRLYSAKTEAMRSTFAENPSLESAEGLVVA